MLLSLFVTPAQGGGMENNMPKEIKDHEAFLNEIRKGVQDALNSMSNEKGKLKIKGTDFESIVYDQLIISGIDEEQITHSPRKFPDFIINDETSGTKIGLEVKKTDESKWKVPGGSVYESLRNQIEETYVLMARLGGTPEARLRKYEECLADLKVTHSPRFQLDLELPAGEDYLTKHNAQDLLNLSEGAELNRRIRELLRTDKNTWYCEDTVAAFSDLSSEEKEKYFIDGVVLFPEVVGKDYSNFAPWLIYKCLVWCKNVRDVFSAGGTSLYEDIYISAIMNRIIVNSKKIVYRISEMSESELRDHWSLDEPNCDLKKRIDTWIFLIKKQIKVSSAVVKKNRSTFFKRKQDNTIRKVVVNKYMSYLEKQMHDIRIEMEESQNDSICESDA